MTDAEISKAMKELSRLKVSKYYSSYARRPTFADIWHGVFHELDLTSESIHYDSDEDYEKEGFLPLRCKKATARWLRKWYDLYVKVPYEDETDTDKYSLECVKEYLG